MSTDTINQINVDLEHIANDLAERGYPSYGLELAVQALLEKGSVDAALSLVGVMIDAVEYLPER